MDRTANARPLDQGVVCIFCSIVSLMTYCDPNFNKMMKPEIERLCEHVEVSLF